LFGWVLTRRKVLFAMHRVIAGWMAVGFCAIFLLAGLMIALVRMNTTALAFVVSVGTGQLVIATVILRRARRRRRELLARRDELAGKLAQHRETTRG